MNINDAETNLTTSENKRKEILEELRETEVKDNELLPIVEYNIEEEIIGIEE